MILYHPETLHSFYHGCDGLNSRIYPAGQLIGKTHIEIRHPSKFFPIAYDTSESVYYAMGEGVDTAFKDGAKLK